MVPVKVQVGGGRVEEGTWEQLVEGGMLTLMVGSVMEFVWLKPN